MDLKLDNLKYPNVYNFNRNFGTKKTAQQNAGSLTTEEFCINSALPFDIMRPVIINEDTTLTNIEYNAKAIIAAANLTLTLGSATTGIDLLMSALYDGIITDGVISWSILAGQTLQFIFINNKWECINPNELFGTVSTASTQTMDIVFSGYTGTSIPIGKKIIVHFVEDYSYSGQPQFTINNGQNYYPITVQGVAAEIGAFAAGKNYEFIFDGNNFDCLNSNIVRFEKNTNGYGYKNTDGIIKNYNYARNIYATRRFNFPIAFSNTDYIVLFGPKYNSAATNGFGIDIFSVTITVNYLEFNHPSSFYNLNFTIHTVGF